MSLIDDIQHHILDHKYPLTSILRQAMVLARKLGSDDLLNWVRLELEGYRNIDDLPDYRRCMAYSIGSAMSGNMLTGIMKYTNVPIPTHILPDEMRSYLENGRLSGGVRELASLLESSKTYFGHLWPNEIIQYYNTLGHINGQLIYCEVRMSRTAVENVLDSVRTRLLEFVIEIGEINPNAGSIPSLEKIDPAVTRNIFKKVIMNENYHGNVQKVDGVYGGNVATGEARISSSHASFTNTTDATNALLSLQQHLNEVAETNRDQVQEAIKLLAAAITDGTITKSRIVAATETIMIASDKMKQMLRDLSVGVSGSLAATGIWEGIRYALGH